MITQASTDPANSIAFDVLITDNNTTPSSSSSIVSDELLNIVNFVNRITVGQFLALFGMGSNIINLLVFYKMGFKEPINVSLFGLALSDFMSCITLAWANLCYTPAFQELDLPFRPSELKYVTGGWTHVIFVKITCCITTFITFERCLCVTLPLKVKNIITSTKVTVFLICSYTALLGLLGPIYYINRPAWKFYPSLNKTLVGLVFSSDRMEVSKWLHPITDVFLFWFFFISTIVFTSILVVSLKKNSEWRKKSAVTSPAANNASNTSQLSSRDAKVSKLVISVSVVFIACFTPQSINAIAVSVVTDLTIGGRYENLMYVLISVPFVLESVNASLNIFIYYFRSSKYKAMFQQMFFFKKTVSD